MFAHPMNQYVLVYCAVTRQIAGDQASRVVSRQGSDVFLLRPDGADLRYAGTVGAADTSLNTCTAAKPHAVSTTAAHVATSPLPMGSHA